MTVRLVCVQNKTRRKTELHYTKLASRLSYPCLCFESETRRADEILSSKQNKQNKKKLHYRMSYPCLCFESKTRRAHERRHSVSVAQVGVGTVQTPVRNGVAYNRDFCVRAAQRSNTKERDMSTRYLMSNTKENTLATYSALTTCGPPFSAAQCSAVSPLSLRTFTCLWEERKKEKRR
jgi:hypothetical protein